MRITTVTLGKWVEDSGAQSMLVWQLSSTRFIHHWLKPVNIHDLDTENSFKNSLGGKDILYIFIYSFYLFVLESPSTFKIILKLNAKKVLSNLQIFWSVHRESSHNVLNNFMLTNWHVETISLFVARWWTDGERSQESDCSTEVNKAESNRVNMSKKGEIRIANLMENSQAGSTKGSNWTVVENSMSKLCSKTCVELEARHPGRVIMEVYVKGGLSCTVEGWWGGMFLRKEYELSNNLVRRALNSTEDPEEW